MQIAPESRIKRKIYLAIIVVSVAGMVLVACLQIPDDTLPPTRGEVDKERYESLIRDARQLFERNPRTVGEVEQAAAKLREAMLMRADDYDTLWFAGRVTAWLAGFHPDDEAREVHAREGLVYVNTALELKKDGPEALYYRGVLAGFLGDLDRSYGLSAVRTIADNMTALIEAGHDIDHAGPRRVYGTLLMRAPGPPASIGNMRNAGRQLEAAVEAHPDWPENQLYLAEWELRQGRERDRTELRQQGRERLQTHLIGPSARAPKGYAFEFEQWQRQARELLE